MHAGRTGHLSGRLQKNLRCVHRVKPVLRATHLATHFHLALLGDATLHANLALRFALRLYCAIHAGVALLVTAQATWRAPSLPVPVVASTIGAGDSFLGALVWALSDGQAMEEAFCMAMAAGASALRAPGTALCDVDDVRQLRQQVQLTRL